MTSLRVFLGLLSMMIPVAFGQTLESSAPDHQTLEEGKSLSPLSLSPVPGAFPSSEQAVLPQRPKQTPFDPGSYRGYGEVFILKGDALTLDQSDGRSGDCRMEVTDDGVRFQNELYPWYLKPFQANGSGGNSNQIFTVHGRCGAVWVINYAILDTDRRASRLIRMYLTKEP